MQDISQLEPKYIDLIEHAKSHAKKKYQENRTSIAAALLCKSGKVFTGVNIKFQTRNVSICGARVALFKAVDEGEFSFSTLVEVKYFPGTGDFEIVNNCGECRQVFIYYDPFDVLVIDKKIDTVKIVSTVDLLPYSYI